MLLCNKNKGCKRTFSYHPFHLYPEVVIAFPRERLPAFEVGEGEEGLEVVEVGTADKGLQAVPLGGNAEG